MSTPTIKIAVSQADATLVQSTTLTAGMVNLPVVKFSFTDEWTGLGKTAVVRAGSVVLEVLVTNNQITIPYECLEVAGVNLIVGIYGTDTSVIIPTVWCSCGEILDGTDTSSATNPGTATQALVDQMLAYAAAIEALAQTLEDYAIRNVAVNTSGANQYGIASVSLADTGAGEDRTLTFHFNNLKGNGIESITWSAAGTYRGRIQITESNGRVTNFDALVGALNYLDSLTNRSEAYATGQIDGVDVGSDDPAYHNNSKYYAEQADDSATRAASSASSAMGYASSASGSKTAAQTAQAAAETAKNAAELAQAASETAEANALLSEQTASTRASEAAASATAAGTSAQAAATSEANAERAESNAAASATAANTSANNASASAASASTSATNASGSATSASGSATTASSAATRAETAAGNAANSAATATSASASAVENANEAEAWAAGTIGGTPVGSDAEQYHNNAKYYADQLGAIGNLAYLNYIEV